MIIPRSLIGRHGIKRGAILHSAMFNDIDHGKFFVVIGVSETAVAGFFFINSRIHHSIMKKQAQLDMQYLLLKSDYPFLRYNSYLCATDIIQKEVRVIAEEIENGKTKIIDQLRPKHLEEVLEMVRGSKLFGKKTKEAFFS